MSTIDWGQQPKGLDDIAADLRVLRQAAGSPSYTDIGRLVSAQRAADGLPASQQRMARSTLFDAFQDGRRRMDPDTVTEIARALGLRDRDLGRWAQRLQEARAAADGAAVVRVLPAPATVPYFAGRRRELGEIGDVLRAGGRVWVSGLPGSGKTQLTLRCAAGLSALYVDLRGDDTEAPTVSAEACQRALLHYLGTDSPARLTTQQRAELVAAALRDSGSLVILDDAPTMDLVAAILGEDSAIPLIVTSRTRAEGTGWTTRRLDGLDAVETAELVRNVAPVGTVIDDETIQTLTELSSGLPLATALVAARLISHPGWTLAEHVQLMEERLRQSRLDGAVRESLGFALASLSPDATALLRAVAVLPSTQFDAEALRALTSRPLPEVDAALEELVQRNLVSGQGGNSALHSLVQTHARLLAEETDPPSARRSAFARLALHLAQKVWAAYEALEAAVGSTPRPTTFYYPARDWTREEASLWLETNRATLLAVAHAAPSHGCPELQLRLSEGMSLWLHLAGYISDGLHLHEAALDTAERLGDIDGLAMASLDAGQLLLYSDRPLEALDHFDRARPLSDGTAQLSDPGLTGLLLNMGAIVRLRKGELTEAVEALTRAVAIHEEFGETTRMLSAMINLAAAQRRMGRFSEAATLLDRIVDVAGAMGHTRMACLAKLNIAELLAATNAPTPKLREATHAAAAAARETGEPYHELRAKIAHSNFYRHVGRHDAAAAAADEATALARRMGPETYIAETLVVSAEARHEQGDNDRALRDLADALRLLDDDLDTHLRSRILTLQGQCLPSRPR